MCHPNDYFVSAPRALLVDIKDFCADWLSDFEDYANDTMNEDEETERQQELERIQRIADQVNCILTRYPEAGQSDRPQLHS